MTHIRIAKQNDLSRILEIYNQAIPSHQSTGSISLLSFDDMQEWFDKHKPDIYPIFIAEKEGQITGWISLSAYREKRLAFRYCAEVSYYVDNNYHRQGIASIMLQHVILICVPMQIKTLVAYILEHNVASIQLMDKFGFTRWATLPNIANFDGKEYSHTIYGKRI